MNTKKYYNNNIDKEIILKNSLYNQSKQIVIK